MGYWWSIFPKWQSHLYQIKWNIHIKEITLSTEVEKDMYKKSIAWQMEELSLIKYL